MSRRVGEKKNGGQDTLTAWKLDEIELESLRQVRVLYEGDVYELASVMLRILKETDRVINDRTPGQVQRTCLSLENLAYTYASVSLHGSPQQIMATLQGQGLPLRASVRE